jgi:hypothetical protein
MSRARFAAAVLAVLTTGVAAIVVVLAPAQAAVPVIWTAPVVATAQAAAQTPVTTTNGTRTLTVDPTTDLPANKATIKVQGKGFDTDHGLYVAVCADDSGAPEDLTTCVGGAIPAANSTTAWAHITADGQGPGGVKAAWGAGGSFSVSLVLPLVTEGDVNCVTGGCSLYTASDDDTVRTEDNAVALTFAAPASSSSASSAPPTVPSTAIPQSIGSPTIVAGGTQKVIFSGFRAGEQVNLTLFSAPITLSPVTADSTGVAQVDFVVPADFAAGTHRLEAIGAQSGTVGVASFQVTAPPVTPTPTPTPSPTPSPSSSASSESSSAPASSSAASSSAPASSAVTSSSSTAAAGGDSGNSLWWLWLIIAIVVIAGIVTGIVVYRRRQQEQRELDEKGIADAALKEQQAAATAIPGADAPTVFLPPVRPSGPPPGADPYGLLSGRDHPDNPPLYSGQQDFGTGPFAQPLGYGGPAQGFPPPAEPGPPTQAMPPTPSDPPSPADPPGPSNTGPGTQSWAPDFDDTDDEGDGKR